MIAMVAASGDLAGYMHRRPQPREVELHIEHVLLARPAADGAAWARSRYARARGATDVYIVPYRVRDNRIQVVRVYHGARKWPERL